MGETDLTKYAGRFSMPGFSVRVLHVGPNLLVAFPGAPPGMEVPLIPQGGHTFLMDSGPAKGAVARFELDEDGLVTGVLVGDNRLDRDDNPEPEFEATGRGLLAPPMLMDDAKESAFGGLFQEMISAGDGRLLNYDLPYPKQEFLRYVAEQDAVIFHGSGDPNIETFVPVRSSMELYDRSGRGNRGAVYGTHDALWPMFFAIIDRPKLTGSIQNGVDYYEDQNGKRASVYHFSINKDLLEARPFRNGTIYLLPRESFVRLEKMEGVFSNEWACEEEVRPLARLALLPEDFPFLDQIGGHDDSLLIDFGELGEAVIGSVLEANPQEDGFELKLAWDESLSDQLMPYVGLVRRFLPQVTLTLRFEANGGAVWLKMGGPAAFQQVLKEQLSKHLATGEV